MKILIWVCAAFIYGSIVVLLGYFGLQIGGLPTVCLGALTFWLANLLCKQWDKRSHSNKVSIEMILNALRQYNTPWPIVIILIVALLGGIYQNATLRAEIRSKDAEILELESEYDRGYEAGLDAGFDLARDDAYSEGYADGHEQGFDEGYLDGYTYGLTDGLYYPESVDDYTQEYLRLRRERLDEEKAD